ncbi:uncharacterized protein LOC120110766 [Phoenix dactylifera]|uniref:Uncharacterized protein LOC120110766 n=1 Tax=Phoenix dactylifera TaxID=42345 RepID=A0A8B9AE75_PHODC|nr:uncharacterized protein LOC120110766 [Phoenix dactylifera]
METLTQSEKYSLLVFCLLGALLVSQRGLSPMRWRRERQRGKEMEAATPEVVRKAERLVVSTMGGRDASHDAAHAFFVHDLALSLAEEKGLDSFPQSLEIARHCLMLHIWWKYGPILHDLSYCHDRVYQSKHIWRKMKSRLQLIISMRNFSN